MRKLIFILTGVILTYSCGGLGDANVNYKDLGVNVAVRSSPYLTAENHPDGWGKSDCLGCHQNFKHTMATADLSVEQYQNMIEKAVNSVGTSKAINVCSACHGLNGVSLNEGAQRQCLVCHDNFERIHFYKGTGSRAQSLHDFNGNGKIDDFDCVVCHWQPDMDGIVEPDTDFGMIEGKLHYKTSDFCLTCHSNDWENISQEAFADINGDGKAEEKISPSKVPIEVASAYTINDWHGDNSYGDNATFKNVQLSNQILFHTGHEALACTQCHNPHASNNDKLIIEKVGETLILEKAIIQSDNTKEVKYAVVDPQTTLYFADLKFSGNVTAENKTYDLSYISDLQSYINLPVKNIDSVDETINRKYMSSLCAACHDGSVSYSPINGLGLSINIEGHYSGKCSECHTHGGTF
ncbi:cytochrome c3 family protein [Desulfurobacterium thermolithotrophum]|uniref:cytochrome c3 family protein n=1 Tax=Desulfurobacterium thermolithotrophum TaxID=64160 RepID=UPI0013D134CC|nr:cytochrome c3 family protein [Desulfurobacterium thermolithotrophum]